MKIHNKTMRNINSIKPAQRVLKFKVKMKNYKNLSKNNKKSINKIINKYNKVKNK